MHQTRVPDEAECVVTETSQNENLLQTLERRLRRTLGRVPPAWRDDALQEAALASLEGRDPSTAVVSFYRREQRHRFGNEEAGRKKTPGMMPMGDHDKLL